MRDVEREDRECDHRAVEDVYKWVGIISVRC
jgi:hypothetical protein